jgi:amino acid transporter
MIWVNNGVMWIAIGVIAVAAIIFRYLERSSRDETLRMLAEKGQPIPPELLHEGSYRGGSIRPGMILMAVGAGAAIMFWGMTGFETAGMGEHSSWLWTLGAIPFLIGAALFVTAIFDRRPPAKND